MQIYTPAVMLSDNLHFAPCKQSNARLKIQTLAVSSPNV